MVLGRMARINGSNDDDDDDDDDDEWRMT